VKETKMVANLDDIREILLGYKGEIHYESTSAPQKSMSTFITPSGFQINSIIHISGQKELEEYLWNVGASLRDNFEIEVYWDGFFVKVNPEATIHFE
jgi:hypothetical protein